MTKMIKKCSTLCSTDQRFIRNPYFTYILVFVFLGGKKRGKQGAWSLYLSKSVKIGEKAAVYTAERFVIQETFLSLKIRGLYSRAVSNQERVIMVRVWYLKDKTTRQTTIKGL